MVQQEVPLVGATVDTNDWSGTGEELGIGTVVIMIFFIMVGVATYGYNRITDLAGVDGEQEIPGV